MPNRLIALCAALCLLATTALADNSIAPAASLVVALPTPPASQAALCGSADRADILQSLMDRCAGERDPELRRGCRHLRRTLRNCSVPLPIDAEFAELALPDRGDDGTYWTATWSRDQGRWSLMSFFHDQECD